MRCTLCPRLCGAERTETAGSGFCRMPAGPVVARAGLHMWEEPCISGTRGSGTVFFSGCTLGCVFCQNHEISAQGVGKPVSVDRLREIFRELIRQGAHNINLVTPGHFAPWVAQALEPSLPVPVVCNTGGYERVETLRLLVVKKVSRGAFIKFVGPYSKGQYYKFPHVARCVAPKVVRIRSEKPDIVTCLDGECITSDDVTIRLSDKRLNFFGPVGCDCNRTARDI